MGGFSGVRFLHRGGVALAASLLAALLAAQEANEAPQQSYTQADSPYMVELDFSLAAPVDIFAEIGGVRVDRVRLDPLGAVEEGAAVRCQVTASGSHTGGPRPTVTIAMLLEDGDGKGLERVRMAEFRPNRGRPFEEAQRLSVHGSALLAARKVFVMIEIK